MSIRKSFTLKQVNVLNLYLQAIIWAVISDLFMQIYVFMFDSNI